MQEVPVESNLAHLERRRLEDVYFKLKKLEGKAEQYAIEAEQTALRLNAENFKLRDNLNKERKYNELTRANLTREFEHKVSHGEEKSPTKMEIFEEVIQQRAYQFFRRMPQEKGSLKRAGNEVVQALFKEKTNVDIQDNDGWSALMLPSRSGHIEIVQALIYARAIPDLKNREGLTALMCAALAAHLNVKIKELLLAKADPMVKGKDGRSAVETAGNQEITTTLKQHTSASSGFIHDPSYSLLGSYLEFKKTRASEKQTIKTGEKTSYNRKATAQKRSKSLSSLLPTPPGATARDDTSTVKQELGKCYKRIANLETRIHDLMLQDGVILFLSLSSLSRSPILLRWIFPTSLKAVRAEKPCIIIRSGGKQNSSVGSESSIESTFSNGWSHSHFSLVISVSRKPALHVNYIGEKSDCSDESVYETKKLQKVLMDELDANQEESNADREKVAVNFAGKKSGGGNDPVYKRGRLKNVEPRIHLHGSRTLGWDILRAFMQIMCFLLFMLIPATTPISLDSNLNGSTVACPGQQVRFECLTNSPLLYWFSREYIGQPPGFRIELSGELDRNGTTRMGRNAVATLLSVSGGNVTSSELVITASLDSPTASVTCLDVVANQSKTIAFRVPGGPGIPQNVMASILSWSGDDCVILVRWNLPTDVATSQVVIDFPYGTLEISPHVTDSPVLVEKCNMNATIGIHAVDICGRQGASIVLKDVPYSNQTTTAPQPDVSTCTCTCNFTAKLIAVICVLVAIIVICPVTTVGVYFYCKRKTRKCDDMKNSYTVKTDLLK